MWVFEGNWDKPAYLEKHSSISIMLRDSGEGFGCVVAILYNAQWRGLTNVDVSIEYDFFHSVMFLTTS